MACGRVMKRLSDKIALVTGSSSGIGKAVAECFAKEGATVIITSNSTVNKGMDVVTDIKSTGGNAVYYSADLRHRDNVKSLFQKIKTDFGRLDILVNNAGRTFSYELSSVTEESLKNDLEINYMSAVYCSLEAIKLMKKGGHIINTASIRGFGSACRKGLIGYGGAKAAIMHFTKALANELAPDIYVNAVAPGLVMTEALSKSSPDLIEKWKKSIPIGRFIETDELSEVYLFLATTRIFTGSIIIADGGYTLLEK